MGCPTPFGIIGILTRADSTSLSAQPSAQRLSASSEFSPIQSSTFTPSRYSAQRLSASSEFSLTHRVTSLFQLKVLNAFRHHRNSHSTPADRLRCGVGRVLNAFR